ncbi:MAG: hypothetical protein L0H25_03600 [Micrococcales bacterium]|nr:hypothetical protein [Micrococcales bacterium]
MIEVAGAPASISVLGGALRSHALRLVDLLDELEAPARRAARNGEPDPDPGAGERELLADVAAQFDRIGALLQAFSTDVVENTGRRRRLVVMAEREGLLIDGRHVIEAPGPSRLDPQARLRSRDRLQDLLNRVTSAGARSLAGLARELDASQVVLARAAERACTGSP